MSNNTSNPQQGLRVGVVGATGAVGEVLLRVLAQRNFPVAELRPLASERSAGTSIKFNGKDIEVGEAKPQAFDGLDVVFFAATGSLSKTLAPEVAKRGGIAIDKSSTWRMDDSVPLVVPEVNPDAVDDHKGIIACPNCTTIGAVMALEPIHRAVGLQSVVITTLQAVSGAGKPGIEELEQQQRALATAQAPTHKIFAATIANNAVPACDNFGDDGFTGEETKLLLETRKIMRLPQLEVSVTCVRVPVPVGHSATMLLGTRESITVADARAALDAFPGVEVVDDVANNIFPTARDVEGRDEVLVGRIRKDKMSDRLWLWQVSDNLRKGAATNAVQIAELLIARGLLGRF